MSLVSEMAEGMGKEAAMSEKRLNNTIFLMYLVTKRYCEKRGISTAEFLKLDEKYAILNYVAEYPDVFARLEEDPAWQFRNGESVFRTYSFSRSVLCFLK